MPSSAMEEVPVLEDNGGEGVADLSDEAPEVEDSTGDGRLGKLGRP